MSAREPGRALRSAAAELARFTDEDVQAILAELDVTSRSRLTELLADYHQGDLPAPAAAGLQPDLTSWLAERASGGGEGRAWAMTPHASRTLARIAAEQGWTTQAARSTAAGGARGLLARVGLR